MNAAIPPEGPDLSRRDFVKTVAAAVMVPSTTPPKTETAAARFYASLKDDQKTSICLPFDHPRRSRLTARHAADAPRIRDLNPGQQSLCREVFRDLCSDDGHDRFLRQMAEDHSGFANYHVATFGTPGNGAPFEWVITGRHLTLRTDGLSCLGPIFYGHASRHPHGNVWWYQSERADAIFRSLDDAHKAQALVPLDHARKTRPTGLIVGDLDESRKVMALDLLRALIQPFRAVREAPRGADALRLSYSQSAGVWALEGPGLSWYFHGVPHVHAWVNFEGPHL